MIQCDLCSKNEAVLHLSEVINGKSRELHLCESCAREKGAEQLALNAPVEGPGGTAAGSLASLLAGLSGQKASAPKLTCPQCGMTFAQFRKAGRFGCAACYEAFSRYLTTLLRRIHGSAHYSGKSPAPKAPKKISEKEKLLGLKAELQSAVKAEAFEKAAVLRDKIRTLEKNG
jgi:protein arginine kinase activator